MIYSKTQKPIVILLKYSWNVYNFMSVAQREVLEYSKLLSEPVSWLSLNMHSAPLNLVVKAAFIACGAAVAVYFIHLV